MSLGYCFHQLLSVFGGRPVFTQSPVHLNEVIGQLVWMASLFGVQTLDLQ